MKYVICNIIIRSNVDIVCLQEVSRISFEMLLSKLHSVYNFYYEIPFTPNDDINGDRNRTIETVCFSKFPAEKYKLFSVEGNLSYNNSMIMVEFNDFIIFNVYLQAGTKNSPGQKDLWFNYSRCRYNEYMSIGKYLHTNNISKPIIVLGDFNTNLNGIYEEWPELKAFDKLNLQDAWVEKYDKNSGFTENTNINLMRWNLKYEEKIFRIDGIFYTRNKLITHNINLLGTEPIEIDEQMQQEFLDYRTPKNKPIENIRLHQGKIKIWPSDHFAVIADLEII